MKRLRRKVLSLTAVLSMLVMPTVALTSTASAATSPPQVQVSANQSWTDTSIDVSGEVTLQASDAYSINVGGPEPIESAAGSSDCTTSTSQFSGSWVALGFPCWSLIARVDDNPPFFVGNGGTFTVPSGRLFLGVDDETLFFGDNSGSWVVSVQSTAPSSPSNADIQQVLESMLFWLTLPLDSLTQDQKSCLQAGFQSDPNVMQADRDACLRDPSIKAIVGLGDINLWKKVLTDEFGILAGAFTQEQKDCLSGNDTTGCQSLFPPWGTAPNPQPAQAPNPQPAQAPNPQPAQAPNPQPAQSPTNGTSCTISGQPGIWQDGTCILFGIISGPQ